MIDSVTADWKLVAAGDLNGDGREDIRWRNTSGNFAVWTMDGAQVLTRQLLDNVSPDWQLLT